MPNMGSILLSMSNSWVNVDHDGDNDDNYDALMKMRMMTMLTIK